jgi:D-alanyl-D-alanine carboxypeptidase (penicillin-binding protein 5/6)
MKHSTASSLLTSLLLCLFFTTISVTPATAVTALRDQAKKPAAAGQKKVQKQSAIKKNTPREIKVLGTPENISRYKKKVNAVKPATVAKVRKKPKVSAKPASKPDTAQTAPQGNDNQIHKKISAKSAIIMDADSGQTLFAVSPDTPRQPASTIKILTGLIAIKSLDSNESVAVSHKAAIQPSSKVHLQQQKRYKADDLINAVLLSSANDASVALAEKIAGSEQSFARMMTLRAKLYGCQNTVCKTANGLTAEGQSSSARDLATIFRHAMEDEEFSQRMKQVKAHTAEGMLLKNHNKALWQIQGAEGGKTGFTNAAGQTYVGKFKRGSREIIVAIMGSHTMWADLKNLVEYGFSQPASAVAGSTKEQKKLVAGIAANNRQ